MKSSSYWIHILIGIGFFCMFAMPVVLLFLGITLSWPVNGVLFDWASTASVGAMFIVIGTWISKDQD